MSVNCNVALPLVHVSRNYHHHHMCIPVDAMWGSKNLSCNFSEKKNWGVKSTGPGPVEKTNKLLTYTSQIQNWLLTGQNLLPVTDKQNNNNNNNIAFFPKQVGVG